MFGIWDLIIWNLNFSEVPAGRAGDLQRGGSRRIERGEG